MEDRPKKCCGPLTWLAGRSLRFCVVAACLPALYVLSFGPTVWLCYSGILPDGPKDAIWVLYRPLVSVLDGSTCSPDWLRMALVRYALLWGPL